MSIDSAAALLAQARALVEDQTLGSVRAFKREHPGWLAVGYMPIYVPRPWLEAIHCLPVGVFGGGDRVEIIRGDSYFQSYICHIPRSTLELALAGQLDVLDGMLFPSICDVIRNLGGMWKMLFPDRYAAYLDLPQDFDRELGGIFYEGELRRIAAELQARGALALDEQALAIAIGEENERRAVLAEMDELRQREPWRLRASEAYLAARAGTLMLARDHTRFLRALLAAVAERPAKLLDNARVVLVGAFCEQPPLDLLRTLERAGCDIVSDDLQLGLRTIAGSIPLAGCGARGCSSSQAGASAGEVPASATDGPASIHGVSSADGPTPTHRVAPTLEVPTPTTDRSTDAVHGLPTTERPASPTAGPTPTTALVHAFLEQGVETASRYLADGSKGQTLVRQVKEAGADGVLFAAASFCDPALLDQPMLEAALDAAGVPHTSLKFAENTGQFQTIREQAGTFSDSVKLWGVA